jgi:hypothetical protein
VRLAETKERPIPFVGWGPGSYRRQIRYDLTKEIIEDIDLPDKEPPLRPPHLQGIQVTVSENHPEWRGVNRPAGDQGGEFTTSRRYVLPPPGGSYNIYTGWHPWSQGFSYRTFYKGPFTVSPFHVPNVRTDTWEQTGESTLLAYGTTAIAKCAPTRPSVDLATSLLDLYHDGLPKLFGKAAWEENTKKALTVKQTRQHAGNEVLNYQFGWVPLVSDVSDFVKTIAHLDKLLKQYARDNGKVVRRKFDFPPEIVESNVVIDANAVPFGPQSRPDMFDFNSSRPQVVRNRKVTVRRWFSGAFIYHLPYTFFAEVYDGRSARGFQALSQTLGLELTPEVLWELAPWSWAVDWFTNVGDIISNRDTWNNDGLVLKYGYIMEHRVQVDTYTWVGPSRLFAGGQDHTPDPLTVVFETKKRRKATPFGFGITFDGFSSVQKAIIAGLALAKF